MAGLRKICKLYGRMQCGDTMFVWDYYLDEPVEEKKMTKEQRALSEKAKYGIIQPKEK